VSISPPEMLVREALLMKNIGIISLAQTTTQKTAKMPSTRFLATIPRIGRRAGMWMVRRETTIT
jgi:hypothetical protein